MNKTQGLMSMAPLLTADMGVGYAAFAGQMAGAYALDKAFASSVYGPEQGDSFLMDTARAWWYADHFPGARTASFLERFYNKEMWTGIGVTGGVAVASNLLFQKALGKPAENIISGIPKVRKAAWGIAPVFVSAGAVSIMSESVNRLAMGILRSRGRHFRTVGTRSGPGRQSRAARPTPSRLVRNAGLRPGGDMVFDLHRTGGRGAVLR